MIVSNFYFSRPLEHYRIVPIFYFCLITICTCGQIAINAKKLIEYRRDLVQARHVQAQLSDALKSDDPQGTKSIKTNNHQNIQVNNHNNHQIIHVNNTKWNEDFCSNNGIIAILLAYCVMAMSATIIQWVIFYGSNLSEERKAQYKYHFFQLLKDVLLPIFIYLWHGKLFKHVKTELFG